MQTYKGLSTGMGTDTDTDTCPYQWWLPFEYFPAQVAAPAPASAPLPRPSPRCSQSLAEGILCVVGCFSFENKKENSYRLRNVQVQMPLKGAAHPLPSQFAACFPYPFTIPLASSGDGECAHKLHIDFCLGIGRGSKLKLRCGDGFLLNSII